MDPAKLKVVELRAELQSRGLETKGIKAVLVKRLKEALEAELETDLPDTSIADTSNEDCNSQDEDCMVDSSEPAKSDALGDAETEVSQTADAKVETPEDKAVSEVSAAVSKVSDDVSKDVKVEASTTETVEPVVEAPEVVEPTQEKKEEEKVDEPMVTEPAKEEQSEVEAEEKPEVQPQTENVVPDKPKTEETQPVEQNGDKTNGDAEEETCEPKAKKSRWGTETEPLAIPVIDNEAPAAAPTNAEEATPDHKEERADKRKHSSPSPERNQRARSKSPIREDEPAVDANKVQLSWCK